MQKIVRPQEITSAMAEASVAGRVSAGELPPVRIPHVVIHVFRESEAFAATWERAARDRQLISASTELRAGGFEAAIRRYAEERSPDLIIVESSAGSERLEQQLELLADLCDPDTRLIVIGHQNDVVLYRKLLGVGVSNYLLAPVAVGTLISAISEIYREPGREKIGRVTAVIGAKGGVGTSTLAQSVALELSERESTHVLLVDLDLSFGTAALNLDVEPNQGLTELIEQPDRIDPAMLDRVVVRRGMHLALLGTSPGLDAGRDIDEDAIERIVDVAQMHIRHTILDLPHVWAPWIERALVAADEVIVVTTPELGSLRNAVAVLDRARTLRPNDPPPRLVLNQVGMPHRQEITARDIVQVLKLEPALSVPFDARSFGIAAARGKLVTEVGRRRPAAQACLKLARMIAPESKSVRRRRSFFWSRRGRARAA